MIEFFNRDYIRKHVANSEIIYQRGIKVYENGAFSCSEWNPEIGSFAYDVDGSFGDYITRVKLLENAIQTSCNCPYPNEGCKHAVAVTLDLHDRLSHWKPLIEKQKAVDSKPEPYLNEDEIRAQALDDRKKRAKTESFKVTLGDMYKGEHMLTTSTGKQYIVTLHDPEKSLGHCSCPDFTSNQLNTCKHIIHLTDSIKKNSDFKSRITKERFPFIDIFWDSCHDLPRLFCERPEHELSEIKNDLAEYFTPDGSYAKKNITDILSLISILDNHKNVRIQDIVMERLEDMLMQKELEKLEQSTLPPLTTFVSAKLYSYQEKGIRFGLYKKAALIGDEMGLGKTLQAIVIGLLKKELLGFERILIVTLASLKEQWKREIEHFTNEKATIISGGKNKRELIYFQDPNLFKITNYEAVLRDIMLIQRFKPDLIILDEAQRIKNFTTKTSDAVKQINKKHALVLTGTPLENKLEDVYSIIQFLDPKLLSPLWKFAANHFMLSRDKKGKIIGYRNLEHLHDKLKSVVIRRRKEEVLSDLPNEIVNNYYIDLDEKQQKMHNGFLQGLLPILNKKILTPIDLRRIQELLLNMRRSCDSTYLIDRKTNISPKLKELEGILDELVIQNGRKLVIFSEWTTMTFLIAKYLSTAGIPFVDLSGKVPINKRQALIDEFTNNPLCKVFLSTDAGGTGLNLQAGDCVVNFELPWNPARMNQRIGRVNRIGQKSRCINVVNLIARNSIEEKILAGIQLKTDLFKGVFDGGTDVVEFSHEKRTELLNRLRQLAGEEPVLPSYESRPSEEIPEDTPHYLNPVVLGTHDQKPEIAYDAEESPNEKPIDPEPVSETQIDAKSNEHSPEKMEEVLNSGMQFLGGLLEMATGKKLEPVGNHSKMIQIDKTTGEVTLKFKLPGF
ncbi:MAG: DEAD/DEAH box helicase family protein [Desulfobacterales bacterium]|nr:DEAD/DEAH box helicase family protein [Desulfobacterales bacterium]